MKHSDRPDNQEVGPTVEYDPGVARVGGKIDRYKLISVLGEGESKPTSVARSIPLNTDLDEDLPLFIQMGSFSSQLNANNMVQTLVAVNETAARISHIQTGEGLLYRVRVGPLFDIDEANAVLSRLRGKGFQTAHIVVQDDAE